MEKLKNFPFQTWQTMSTWSCLCAHVHHHAGAGLGLVVPVKVNCAATGYEGILYYCVLPNLCQQIREEPYISGMVRVST